MDPLVVGIIINIAVLIACYSTLALILFLGIRLALHPILSSISMIASNIMDDSYPLHGWMQSKLKNQIIKIYSRSDYKKLEEISANNLSVIENYLQSDNFLKDVDDPLTSAQQTEIMNLLHKYKIIDL